MALESTGLEIRRLDDIINDIVSKEQTNIDPNINTDSDTLLGQLNLIISEAISAQEELSQAVYDSFNVLVAEGKSLDDLAAIVGTTRSPAVASFTDSQSFTGDEGTVIFSGTVLENPTSLERYVTTTPVTLSISSCTEGRVTTQTENPYTVYSLSVNSVDYSYTSDGSTTEGEILKGLRDVINLDTEATWIADRIDSELIITSSTDDLISISSLVSLLPTKATNITDAEAVETGAISTSSGVVSQLITLVGDSTTNTEAYITGRDEETDEELRQRLLTSQQIGGSATVEAITDNLLSIDEVTDVTVTENNTDDTVDGIPPHAFRAFVKGGDTGEIALNIWDNKPAGINTIGNTSIAVTDSKGNIHTIEFSRPAIINLAFRITYTVYDEEVFPADGEDLIKKSTIDTTDDLGLGKDVIPSRYFGGIYNSVEGVDSLIVEVQIITNSGDTPNPANWQTTKLDINNDELANTEILDIEVIGV